MVSFSIDRLNMVKSHIIFKWLNTIIYRRKANYTDILLHNLFCIWGLAYFSGFCLPYPLLQNPQMLEVALYSWMKLLSHSSPSPCNGLPCFVKYLILFGEKISLVINFHYFHVIWLVAKITWQKKLSIINECMHSEMALNNCFKESMMITYLIRLGHYHRKRHQRALLSRHGMRALGMVTHYACATPREINSPSRTLTSTNFISKEGFSNNKIYTHEIFVAIWYSEWFWADNASLKPSLLRELNTTSLTHP